ncbi:MAG: hypothetical protein OXC08_11290 [Thiotrichales bacterium]|nr:hypothetical protein [Thiotrichales bacterium]
MPNATDQSTDRTRRGTLFILVLVAVIGVGLWYVLERPKIDGQISDAVPPAGVSEKTDTGTTRTADSGTDSSTGNVGTTEAGTAVPADTAPTADSGTAIQGDQPGTTGSETTGPADVAETTDPGVTTGTTNQSADSGTADSDSAAPTDVARTPDPGTTASGEGSGTADSGTAAPTDIAQPADPDITTGTAVQGADSGTADSDSAAPAGLAQTGDPGTADSGTAAPTDVARRTESDAPSTSGQARTPEETAADATDTTRTADSRTTGPAQEIATATEELIVAPAPESAIEKRPLDAPPAADAGGETGLISIVERAIERVETEIRERLATEPEDGTDPPLEVQVTYDDSQGDGTQADAETTPPTRSADSDGTVPAGGAGTAGTGVADPADTAQSTDSNGTPSSDAAPTTVAALTPDAASTADTTLTSDAASTADTALTAEATQTADADADADAEAKHYVEQLTDTAPRTIPVDKADHFVTQDHVLSLVPEDSIESVPVDKLVEDETLSEDTPITVVREVEQVETAVPEQLIAESGGDLDQPLRVQVTYDDTEGAVERGESPPKAVEEDVVEQITVREALERIRTEPERPLSVIRTVRYFEVTTLRELLADAPGDDTFLNVVTRPYRIASATLADLLQRRRAENPDSIFYLHTVQPTDEQGIWGIVHFGLIDNFARGIAVRRGEDVETYTVRIPRDADERLEDQSSSFLGKLIDRKTKDSFVYNYRDNRMGRNPDRIYPGQEIVIINFEPEELTAIYRHFATS